MVASTSGETIDNKRRVDVIKQQEELIKEEEREKMEKNETKVSLLSFFSFIFHNQTIYSILALCASGLALYTSWIMHEPGTLPISIMMYLYMLPLIFTIHKWVRAWMYCTCTWQWIVLGSREWVYNTSSTYYTIVLEEIPKHWKLAYLNVSKKAITKGQKWRGN